MAVLASPALTASKLVLTAAQGATDWVARYQACLANWAGLKRGWATGYSDADRKCMRFVHPSAVRVLGLRDLNFGAYSLS